jgi:predicted MFS family arabinose efflux permease
MFFVNGANCGVWATQIPLVKSRLGLDPSVLGATLFLIGVGAVAAMSVSGRIIQRVGVSAFMRVGFVLFLICMPLACIAPSVWSLALVLFFFGASGGSLDVAMNVAASAAEKRAGRPWMSSFHGMWSVGGLIGAGVATLLLTVISGSWQGLTMAVVLAAVFAVGQRTLRDDKQPATAARGSAALRPGLIAIAIGVMAGLCFSGEGAVLDWAAIYLRDSLGATIERADAGYVAFSGAMSVGRFCGDRLRRSVEGTTVIRIGCLLVLVGLSAGPISNSPMVAVAGYALAGLGFSNMVPVLFSAAGSMPHPETQIAVASTVGYAGFLAAPPLFGFVGHATSLATIFYVVAASTIVIAVLCVVCAPAKDARSVAFLPRLRPSRSRPADV